MQFLILYIKTNFYIIFCPIKLTNQFRDNDCSELLIELFRLHMHYSGCF